MKQPLSGKLVSQKNISSNINIENNKLNKKFRIKLQPLIAAEPEHNVTEGKISQRLKPPCKPTERPVQKKLSKIPVLQRKTQNAPKQSIDVNCDTGLSAADRRQKFHQSRIRIAVVPSNNGISLSTKERKYPNQELFAWQYYAFPNVCAIPIPGAIQKNVLPPIKAVDFVTVTAQKASQPKPKCLLGEITHFPTLCNPVRSKQKKQNTSTVPHLPPIFPPPAAPPPSISTSLEQDGHKVKEQQRNYNKRSEEWNQRKYANIVAV